jgi:hypothetical protein
LNDTTSSRPVSGLKFQPRGSMFNGLRVWSDIPPVDPNTKPGPVVFPVSDA